MNTNYQVSSISRMFIILVGLLGAIFLLGEYITLSSYAANPQSSGSNLPPRWIESSISDRGYSPDVYQNYIVWSESDSLGQACSSNTDALPTELIQLNPAAHPIGLDQDICIYDTTTGETSVAFDTDTTDYNPRMDGDWIVISRGRTAGLHTLVRNIITGEEIILAQYSQEDTPNIHNSIVAFKDYIGGEGVYAYDLTARKRLTITVPCLGFCVQEVDVFNNIIVWNQNTDPGLGQDYNVLGYDLTSQTYFTVSDKPGDESAPRIDHGIVTWYWNLNIYAYDLDARERMTITNNTNPKSVPVISENLIVWSEDVGGPENEIMAYDLTTQELIQLTENDTPEYSLAVWGNLVAFDHPTGGISAVRKMTEFSFQPLIVK